MEIRAEEKKTMFQAAGVSKIFEWKSMRVGDVGSAVVWPWKHRSVEVTGQFGSGAVELQGSLTPPEETHLWIGLKDIRGLPMIFEAAGGPDIRSFRDPVFSLRPEIIGGDENLDLTVRVMFLK